MAQMNDQSRKTKLPQFSWPFWLCLLTLLGASALIVMPRFYSNGQRARPTAARTQIQSFKTALDAYRADTGVYPKGSSGLITLLVRPDNSPNWRGPYFEKQAPLDPWGNPYIYICPGVHNPQSYDLSSMGPDGKPGTADDICNWQ